MVIGPITLCFIQSWAESQEKIAQLQTELVKRELAQTITDLLRNKGILTSRGVLEFVLQKVSVERGSRRFNATDTLDWLQKTDSPSGSFGKELKEIFMSCNITEYNKVYQNLCGEIHGAPWAGMGVKIFAQELEQVHPGHLCVIKKICKMLNVQIE